jgi:hypothetical protein
MKDPVRNGDGRFRRIRRLAAVRGLAGCLPVVALAATMSACTASTVPFSTVPASTVSSSRATSSSGLPPAPDLYSGDGTLAHPVTDLDLEQLVPPGGVAVTAAPIHGSSPSSPPGLALGRFAHLGGTVNVVFLCLGGTDAAPVGNTWYDSSGPLSCDPGPDTQSLAVCHETDATGQKKPCSGRNFFLFSVANTARAVMPQFNVPATGVTWTLFAWIAPPGYSATSGVTAAGGRPSRFAGYGLSFSYPRGWYSLASRQVSLGVGVTGTLVFEGTAPLRDSCPVSVSEGIVSGGFPCGQPPVAMLSPGGLLVSWTTNIGETTLTAMPGASETVAGRPARVFSGSARPASGTGAPFRSVEAYDQPAGPRNGPSCSQIGGDQMVEATISLGPGSVDEMIACIRAPRIGQSLTEVLAMLKSLRLT